jgi:endoglucanase
MKRSLALVSALAAAAVGLPLAGTAAAAAKGQVPVLVAYDIPNRDCGGASAGGAPTIAFAGQVLHADDPNVRVYFDGGHSDWNPPAQQATALKAAGVTG